MKVYFFPPPPSHSPYMNHFVDALERQGVTVVNRGKTGKAAKLLSSFSAMRSGTDLYQLNFLENYSSRDTIQNRFLCACILLWLSMMKASGGTLSWTMHNREPHFASGDRTFHYAFMRKLIARMDMILVHSRESEEILVREFGYPRERICYVPHGNYMEPGETPVFRVHEKLCFLAFGTVMRYKNIPTLIRVFRELDLPDAELRICGAVPADERALLPQIEAEMRGARHIRFEEGYVPDDRIDEIFAASDVVVVPYEKKSMLNSGVVMMALTKGKPVLASRFGAVKDMETLPFIYAYDYDDESGHPAALKSGLEAVYQDWTRDHALLLRAGQAAFRYAEEELDWNRICEKVVSFYQKILSKS